MAATISFREDGRDSVTVDVDVLPQAEGFVLADADGREHHFGCGQWSRGGEFVYVATYGADGREKIYWWRDILDALGEGWSVVEEPQLGPRLSPLVQVALDDMADTANKVNGFTGYEKDLAVVVLRALWDEAQEGFDPVEVEVWAATHGWGLKQAKDLRELADGVRHGTRFRGVYGRAISRDRERERAMVEHWRTQLEERDDHEAR
jgi:hypothetical protein